MVIVVCTGFTDIPVTTGEVGNTIIVPSTSTDTQNADGAEAGTSRASPLSTDIEIQLAGGQSSGIAVLASTADEALNGIPCILLH